MSGIIHLKMEEAPIPKNEQARLGEVRRLSILDTPREERFDRITRLALKIFNVPISTISIIDKDREWYKSCQGLSAKEGARAISFCGHALLDPEIFIIPDTKKDPRFARNPMVIGRPHIRFYAGVPIKSAKGERVGVFCIKDTKPRRINKEQISILKYLASWAELEINVHKLSQAIEARRFAEEKVSNLNEILHLLNKTMRHDILNNLTVIRLSLEFLRRKGFKEKYIQSAELAISRGERLINQMRELETAVSQGAPLKPFKLRKNLKKLLQQFPEMELKVKKDLSVWADQALGSVFENLINNAKIHGKASKITVSAVPLGRRTDGKTEHIQINIADNGTGIPHNIKRKLFVEGHKYGSTGHTGLGLYIVKKTIERYGGKILLKGNRPRGTLAVIRLFSVSAPAAGKF